MSIDVQTEVLIAVCSAMSEQLDLDRLLVALHRQTLIYEADERPQIKEVAETLKTIGGALYGISQLREKKGGPEH